MPWVPGPIEPIGSIARAIEPAITMNTPGTPNSRSTEGMMKTQKIPEKRLHERLVRHRQIDEACSHRNRSESDPLLAVEDAPADMFGHEL